MSSDQSDRDDRIRQDIDAGRDAYVAARDLTVIQTYAAGAGEPSQGSLGQPAVGNQVVVGDVPLPPPGFQPRAELLAELDAAGPGISVVHAVTGMRGVGKTQLAAAYARAKLADGWRLIAWVNAEDPGSLLAGLAAVAEAVGLGSQRGRNVGEAVRHWLEADGHRRLVVFDNATDADALRPYVPVGGAAHVVITSNRQSLTNLGNRVGVEVFTPEEALAFLADRTSLSDTAGAGELAVELGYLPLALAQAAALIAGQHLDYRTYMERLRVLPLAEYLVREPGLPYPHGLAEAVLLSLDAVQASDRTGVCAGILELMSVLSAAGVRRDLVLAAGQMGVLGARPGVETGVTAVDAALGQLSERSLVSFSLDSQAVIVHRLVQRVVRDQLAKQERLVATCQAAASVLEERAWALADSPDRLSVRDIPEQVAALRDAVDQCGGTSDAELAAALLRLRAWALFYLTALGDSAQQAILIGEPLIADQERILGSDHSATLTSRNELAKAYWVAGRTGEAIALHEQTLARRKRALGSDHPDTLSSRNNLAITYAVAGRIAEAIVLLEDVLPDRERVLGPDHHDTIGSRNNLANAYRAVGRADEAIALYQQALAAFERERGAEHRDTLTARSNLAVAYQDAGRTPEAIALHEQTLADRERVMGPDHPDTLQSRNNLALTYRDAGRTDEAITLLEQTLVDQERVLGADHPDILETRDNLGIAYQAADRTDEAIALHEQNLAACERLLGPDHPNTVASRDHLADARKVVGPG